MRGFSEIINVEEQDLFFSFTPFPSKEHPRYSVTVALSGSSSVSFQMERSVSGYWRLADTTPAWITGLQAELTNAIQSHC